MPRPIVVILHRPADPVAPPLTHLLATARGLLVEHQRRLFRRAGADRVLVVTDRAASFGERLGDLARRVPRRQGIVVLGSGAVPLLRPDDVDRLLATASGGGHRALTNNRYSSDVCAVSDAGVLRGLPALPTDNALPRWLEEHRGYRVREMPGRRRLGVDLDTPLDLALLAHARAAPGPLRALADVAGVRIPRLERVAGVLSDRRAELLVAGRTSPATLRWLERHARCRVRALVEERGLRASSTLALVEPADDRERRRRPPTSILGRALVADGPASVGAVVEALADGAVIDARVLLADRLGADETTWPSDEDRFASDLLRGDEVRDGWLADLTRGAASASVPILLGGHSLVGPGLPLLARAARGAKARGHGVE